MDLFIHIIIFLVSCTILYYAGNWIINGIIKVSHKLGWKEFIVAFVMMASAASLPNLLVGVSSALRHIPELSFGDVMGGNLVALTVATALAIIFSAKQEISAYSRTVQMSLLFTVGAAILPPLLVLNGVLSRLDGVILIMYFFVYIIWLYLKRDSMVFQPRDIVKAKPDNVTDFKKTDFFWIFSGLVLVVVAAQGIVVSASFFAEGLGMSLVLVGILIVALGNALPQTYFAVSSSRRGQHWLMLGSIMGSIIIPATLVLGIVALIQPIEVATLDAAIAGRFFLLIAILVFFLAIKTSQKLILREAYMLAAVYILFVGYMIFIF